MIVDKLITAASIIKGISDIVFLMLESGKTDPVKRVVEILEPFSRDKSESLKNDVDRYNFILKMEERYEQVQKESNPT